MKDLLGLEETKKEVKLFANLVIVLLSSLAVIQTISLFRTKKR